MRPRGRRLGLLLGLLLGIGCRNEEKAPAALPSLPCAGSPALRIAAQPGEYLHAVAGQESRDIVLTVRDPQGRELLQVDSLPVSLSSSPAEEIHWVTEAPGELRIELTLPAGFSGPCGLRLAEQRKATAADRQRVLAEVELARGHALRRTGDPKACSTGIAPYDSAQQRFAGLGLPQRRAEALLGLGLLHKRCLRDGRAALRAFQRIEPLFSGDPALESTVRQHAGEIHQALGHLEGAVGEYRRALELRRQSGNPLDEALTSNTLGHALHLLGRYDEAATLFNRALALCPAGGDHCKRAAALLNRGQLHWDLGEGDQARERFQEALDLFRQTQDRDGEAAALNALGIALVAEQPGAALEPLERALALRTPGSRGWAVTLVTLGVAYRHLGRLEEARRSYAEALPVFLRLGDVREQARALNNLGRLEADAGHETAALDHFDQALGLYRTLDDPPLRSWALDGKARVLHRRGDLAAARGLLEDALAGIERHRFRQTSLATRADFFATRQESYEFLIGLLLEMDRKEPGAGYAAAALEVSERSLARSLLDGLAVSGTDLQLHARDPRDPRNPRYTALTQPRPWSAAAIQRELLDRDTLLLEYRLGEERSFLWAVTPDALESFVLPGRAEIERVARRAGGLLARSRNRKAEISAHRQLAEMSRLLLGPVAPLLPGKRLLVVADGALQSVPFAALPAPGGGELLVAHHEIVALPSVSVLGQLRRETAVRPAAPKTLWVLADPDFGRLFTQLRHTRQEAASILALVPPAGRSAVLGREARRAAVLNGALRDYRFLHFATHGSFAATDPGGGRLVLAQTDPRGRPEVNGFLHLADIYELDLRADLVVLSACQSALGPEVRGEGMAGMTRGFFYAGAERVLVSLWNVNDRVTAELMQQFYRGVLREGLSPAAALRAAQNGIRRRKGWQAPYYWAGFTLQGEWRGERPP